MSRSEDSSSWLSIVLDIGSSVDTKSLPILHQVVAYGLCFSASGEPKSKDADITTTKSLVKALVCDGTLFCSDNQVQKLFSIGLRKIIDILLAHNDSQTLQLILLWMFRIFKTEQWEILSFSNILHFIVVIPSDAALSSREVADHQKRCTVLIAAFECALKNSHNSDLSSVVLSVLSDISSTNIIKTVTTEINDTASKTKVNIDNFRSLFDAAAPHDYSHAFSIVSNLMKTDIKSVIRENDHIGSNQDILSLLELLSLTLDTLFSVSVIQNSEGTDILHIISDTIPQYFQAFTYGQRTRIFHSLLNFYHHNASTAENGQFCQQLLFQLLSIVAEEHPMFCPHTEVYNFQGFANTLQADLYQSTFFVGVYKVESLEEQQQSLVAVEDPLDAFLAPTLTSFLLSQQIQSKSEESFSSPASSPASTTLSMKIKYMLTCIQVATLLHATATFNYRLFSKQGILISTQVGSKEDMEEDDDDVNDDQIREKTSIIEINNDTRINVDNNKEMKNKKEDWRKVATSEEDLWHWICRPAMLYLTATEIQSLARTKDEGESSNSPAELFQLALERLLVIQYLTQRLCLYHHCCDTENITFNTTNHEEFVYVAVAQIVAQRIFIRHLISLAKAKIYHTLQQQQQNQQQASAQANSDDTSKELVDLQWSLKTLEQLLHNNTRNSNDDSSFNFISGEIPLLLWLTAVSFLLQEDPCLRYTANVYILLECVSYLSHSTNNDKRDSWIVGKIQKLLWLHLPLLLSNLEQLRVNKSVLKQLSYVTPYTDDNNNSSSMHDDIPNCYLAHSNSTHNHNSNKSENNFLETIEKSVVRGTIVKRDDYRLLVSAILAYLSSTDPSLLKNYDDNEDHSDNNSDDYINMSECFRNIVQRLCTTNSTDPTDTAVDNSTVQTNVLSKALESIASAIALLPSTFDNNGRHNNSGDNAARSFVCMKDLINFVSAYLQDSQDALIIWLLSQLLLSLSSCTNSSGSSNNIHDCSSDRFKSSLWQVQRQLITDYVALESILDIYRMNNNGCNSSNKHDYSVMEGTLFDSVYNRTWPRILQLQTSSNLTDSTSSSLINEINAKVNSLSVLQDIILKHSRNNNIPFHAAYVVRGLFVQWLSLQNDTDGIDNENHTNSTDNGSNCARIGVHFLLQDMLKSYEVLAKTADARIQEKELFTDSSNSNNYNSGTTKRSFLLALEEETTVDEGSDENSSTSNRRKRVRANSDHDSIDINSRNGINDHRAKFTSLSSAATVIFPNIHDDYDAMINSTNIGDNYLHKNSSSSATNIWSSTTIDHLLDMVLTWLNNPSRWSHILQTKNCNSNISASIDNNNINSSSNDNSSSSNSGSNSSSNGSSNSGSTADSSSIDWSLYILTLETWHVLQAWFAVHCPPTSRQIAFLAQWTQRWTNECVLVLLECLTTLLFNSRSTNGNNTDTNHSQNDLNNDRNDRNNSSEDRDKIILALLLLASVLQAAQRFFTVILSILKSSQHVSRNHCLQVIEECEGLITHILDNMVFENYFMDLKPSIDTGNDDYKQEKEEELRVKMTEKWYGSVRNVICDALFQQCSFDSIYNSAAIDSSASGDSLLEKLEVRYWTQFFKQQMLVPWIEKDIIGKFIPSYEMR